MMTQENIYVPGETYTSARATPELVGREKERKQIEKAIKDTEHSYIVYITGQGGIGKTRLVKHVLEHPPEDMPLVVASELIDLYHTKVHSVTGLVGAILEVIPELENFFKEKVERSESDEFESLARAEQEGLSLSEVIVRREKLTNLFLNALNEFTKQRRLVIALDTAERLLVKSDPAQQILELTKEHPTILDWLLQDFLPHIKNTVVLLAGRPEPGNLRTELEQVAKTSKVNTQLEEIELAGLEEEESLTYFEAVIQHAEKSNDPSGIRDVTFIRDLSREERLTIFYCLCDSGDPPTVRPILLALAIDHLAINGHLLDKFATPLESARSLTEAQRDEIRRNLGKKLAQAIRESNNQNSTRTADYPILIMGWLRKGANAELLSRITGWNMTRAEQVLGSIRDLSFVKIRPTDERIFLHDEMYDIIQQYALVEGGPEQKRVFTAIGEYYKELVKQAREDIAALYRPLAGSTSLPDPSQVITLRARLRDALVEDLYYRLNENATNGFQTYFRYAEEAIVANDESLDMQLRRYRKTPALLPPVKNSRQKLKFYLVLPSFGTVLLDY